MRRRIVQIITFIIFVFLFLQARFPLPAGFPAGGFLRVNPLVAVTSFLAGRRIFLPLLFSAGLLILSLFLGRCFCGWLCPLGSVFDAVERCLPRKANILKSSHRRRQIKHLLLIFILAAAVFSFNSVGFFDPLILLARFFSLLVYPAGLFLGEKGMVLLRLLASKTGIFPGTYLYLRQLVFPGAAFLSGFLLILLGLNVLERRFFCRNLCPLGGLLGLISRFSLVRRAVSVECTECGKCWRICPTGAIREEKPRDTFTPECIVCLDCAKICPVEAITFTPSHKEKSPVSYSPGRREFVFAGIFGIAGAVLFNTGLISQRRKGKILRPPGALPEDDFLDQCLRCGLCAKSCPTGVIQPVAGKRRLFHLWTPEMVMSKGACEPNCNVCGQVCPTGAIRALSLEEKVHARIGTARVDQNRCVAWSEGRLCLVCTEVCPYGAIAVHSKGNYGVPAVIPERCAGCGMCENHCPVGKTRDGVPAAIRVYPEGAKRFRRGSYRTGSQISLRRRAGPPAQPEELPAGFVK